MHDIGDLILEGVVNSIEAGASNIEIDICKKDDAIAIKIKDDGSFTSGLEFFAYGFSTRGERRGNGLALIKAHDECASLENQDGFTLLSFTTKNDGSLEKLEDVLFPIFQMEANIKFRYSENEEEILSLEGNGNNLQTVREIAEFKHMIRTRKGVCDVETLTK